MINEAAANLALTQENAFVEENMLYIAVPRHIGTTPEEQIKFAVELLKAIGVENVDERHITPEIMSFVPHFIAKRSYDTVAVDLEKYPELGQFVKQINLGGLEAFENARIAEEEANRHEELATQTAAHMNAFRERLAAPTNITTPPETFDFDPGEITFGDAEVVKIKEGLAAGRPGPVTTKPSLQMSPEFGCQHR